MIFSSPIFLFFYLPLFLLGYYVILSLTNLRKTKGKKNHRFRVGNMFILAASLMFYYWGEDRLVLVMLTSTVVDYYCGIKIGLSTSKKKRKRFLIFSICVNLALLSIFKYFNFGLENFNAFVDSIGLNDLQLKNVMEITLPLGISFYTFQSMSYTIDVYRGEVKPTRKFIDFACFVTMFPQLVAGPIVRYRDISAQIVDRTMYSSLFASGCVRFILGLGKKVLIANTVALPADKIFSIPTNQLTTELAWLGIVCYTLQIYYDFSGYSDMAIGLGSMLGFTFPENFNYPYASKSIQEFWRRWHISLSTWFRDYLYIPLGGGRRNPARVYLNLFLVFLLCGLWHGAAWVFIIWGIYHGLFLVIERLGFEQFLKKQIIPVRHLYSVLVIMGGWVIFRSENLSQALGYYSSLMGFSDGNALQFNMQMNLTNDVVLALVVGILFAWPVLPWFIRLKQKTHNFLSVSVGRVFHLSFSSLKIMIVLTVFFLSAMSISSGAYNPFIYFRF